MLAAGGVPILACCGTRPAAEAIAAAMREGRAAESAGFAVIAIEDRPTLENRTLRKRETPFAGRLEPAAIPALERASYKGAYKGVTDLLTKYLWPEWAFVLTRIAARWGITPNMVTAAGALLCVVATILFWYGYFWTGLAAGLVFMVLDTVDGKLARCTITSSGWGEFFDHGIDLVHPPFWWFAWGIGLAAWGLGWPPALFWTVQAALFAGYALQRLIEGAFIACFGMHIHVWRKVDSDFRLVTARRNPNVVILFVSLLFGRPDIGLLAVVWWTILSLAFHLVRLAQAFAWRARGHAVTTWLG
jgi:phosphatidylglycerophosphate synthase